MNYSEERKNESPHILASDFKHLLETNYQYDLKVYTDGSVLDTKYTGAAFFIPSLNVEKSFHLGEHFSIFTAELVAILMALHYLQELKVTPYQILFCVDSKSVLQSLLSLKLKVRSEIILKIRHLIHVFFEKGIAIRFCWVPSHCGILHNEIVDRAAKKGAKNEGNSTSLKMLYDLHEGYALLEKEIWEQFEKDCNTYFPNNQRLALHLNWSSSYSPKIIYLRKIREITGLANRIKLNALKTKFSKNIECVCGAKLTLDHLLQLCHGVRQYLPNTLVLQILSYARKDMLLNNSSLLIDLSIFLLKSPLANFL